MEGLVAHKPQSQQPASLYASLRNGKHATCRTTIHHQSVHFNRLRHACVASLSTASTVHSLEGTSTLCRSLLPHSRHFRWSLELYDIMSSPAAAVNARNAGQKVRR